MRGPLTGALTIQMGFFERPYFVLRSCVLLVLYRINKYCYSILPFGISIMSTYY